MKTEAAPSPCEPCAAAPHCTTGRACSAPWRANLAWSWELFKTYAADPHIPAKDRRIVTNWITDRDAQLTAEFAAGELPDHWANGPVEQVLFELKRNFKPRAFCDRTAERTNRLLELMRLHHNGVDNMGRYAATIRDHLHDLHLGGRLPTQGAIRDPRGVPSLR